MVTMMASSAVGISAPGEAIAGPRRDRIEAREVEEVGVKHKNPNIYDEDWEGRKLYEDGTLGYFTGKHFYKIDEVGEISVFVGDGDETPVELSKEESEEKLSNRVEFIDSNIKYDPVYIMHNLLGNYGEPDVNGLSGDIDILETRYGKKILEEIAEMHPEIFIKYYYKYSDIPYAEGLAVSAFDRATADQDITEALTNARLLGWIGINDKKSDLTRSRGFVHRSQRLQNEIGLQKDLWTNVLAVHSAKSATLEELLQAEQDLDGYKTAGYREVGEEIPAAFRTAILEEIADRTRNNK